ncbi:hypothetical protein BKA70DRAFT_1424671 [Coprinopsis sp. MPI-PUGE-AT-0042]|nr:hypothetical protein BKA70DRAFT_1424671 [Coprinopsis sp. MPI-PUGE-AT-0042]
MWRNEQVIENLKDQISSINRWNFRSLRPTSPGIWPSGAIIELAVGFVNDFNSEALQAALSFADGFEAGTFFLGSVELMPLEKQLVLALGGKLARGLRASDTNNIHAPDALLSIAVKACVTNPADWFINSWYPFERGHLDFI